MFKILRYYSFASFISIVLAAVVMLGLYRAVSIRGIEALAETSNLALAEVAMSPIRSELADYLAAVAEDRGPRSQPVALPEDLDVVISELMRDKHVSSVKIYNRHGVVSFSTKHDQIGTVDADNAGFAAAMKGRVSVKLVYRDTFNPFDGVTEDDNLVESYIPVRLKPTEPVLGVFELYTDVDAMVRQAERYQILAVAATVLVLALLYVVLLLVVRRASDIIESQARTIREKSVMLEALSRESVRREERERKTFATDLHEGLAQTLSAVKLAIERARSVPDTPGGAQRDALQSVVPDLQGAIAKARSIAMDLRPPSLDDLGLMPTIDAECREFGEAHPWIQVEQRFTVSEALIPVALKIVIYRIVEAALRIVANRQATRAVSAGLEMVEGMLELAIEVEGSGAESVPGSAKLRREGDSPFMEIEERVVISGGHLSIVHDEDGGMTLRAAWAVVLDAVPLPEHI